MRRAARFVGLATVVLVPAAAVAQAAGADPVAIIMGGGAGLVGSLVGGFVGGWYSARRTVREKWKSDTLEVTREEMDARQRQHVLDCPLRNGALRLEAGK